MQCANKQYGTVKLGDMSLGDKTTLGSLKRGSEGWITPGQPAFR